jgi:2,4-dienoyl-CoA reductase-like NADH-dependent reductase (Old Yellow Enzyme family)
LTLQDASIVDQARPAPQTPSSFPHLFSHLSIGKQTAKNRVVRSATTTSLAEKNDVSERLLAHYRSLAKGGAGIIVTESLRPHPALVARASNVRVFDPRIIPGLTRWAEFVHAEGALLFGQLQHGGRQHTATAVPARLIGPSAIACPRSGGVPHAMTDAEIRDYIAHNVVSAKNLVNAGFDGVEIHGAQGHLVQQFLSPFSNRRKDEWGGSWERRKQFPQRMLEDIRAAVPPSFVVGYRIGIEEFTEGGWTLDMSIQLLREFTADGLIDYASLSQGNFNTIDTHLPDRHYPMMPYLAEQSKVKAALPSLITIASTRIVSPEQAESVLAEGFADAIALGRALTVDPDWPSKAQQGEAASIRLCISCNSCWGGLDDGTPITCVQNPIVGRETELGELVPAKTPKTIVVVGGGPAGMETARVAAARGHRVTLFEKAANLGGKTLTGAVVAGHFEYANVARYLDRKVRQSRIDLRLGTLATIDAILALAPDAVVVATGATPVASEIDSDNSVAILAALDAVPTDLSGKTVLMLDEDGFWWGAQTAQDLAKRGGHLILVTRFFEPFRELPVVSRIAALRNLDRYEVEVIALNEPSRIVNGKVFLRHYSSGREKPRAGIDCVLVVGPQSANDELVQPLTRAGLAIHLVGDVYAPRRLRHAIHEGHQLGRRL